MTKIIIASLLFVSILSCSDNKAKTSKSTTSTDTTPKPADSSPDDKVMTTWLEGKEWKADSVAAPIELMRLYTQGKLEFAKPADDQWSYIAGEFGWYRNGNKYPLVTWPLKKVDEQSFTLYVAPTQKTYVYKFVKNL